MFRLRNKKTNFCHALLSEGIGKEIQFDAKHKRIDKIGYLFSVHVFDPSAYQGDLYTM